MGITTGISWTDHTFNPWRGCEKVSEECQFCYAETMSHRNPEVLGYWGKGKPRTVAAESYWKQPIAWNKAAIKAGVRRRVFCASLADVFEDRDDLTPHRRRLWEVIVATPQLDWLLLTKRPQNVARMLGPNGINFYAVEGPVPCPQPNVWIGTSTGLQSRFNERWPHLAKCPAAVRFISYEPALGPLDIDNDVRCDGCGYSRRDGEINGDHHLCGKTIPAAPDWLICGCESQMRGAVKSPGRPMETAWAEKIAEQCRYAGVAFFMKQMAVNGRVTDDPADFPESLRVQEFPVHILPLT